MFIRKSELEEMIRDEVERILMLREIPEINREKMDEYIRLNYKDNLTEMAKLNKKDFELFPYNKFDIRVWSNDNNPPHIHVSYEDWEIIVGIEDGKIIKTKSVGKNSSVYTYVEKNINKWLDQPCPLLKNQTNREFAMATWETIDDFN